MNISTSYRNSEVELTPAVTQGSTKHDCNVHVAAITKTITTIIRPPTMTTTTLTTTTITAAAEAVTTSQIFSIMFTEFAKKKKIVGPRILSAITYIIHDSRHGAERRMPYRIFFCTPNKHAVKSG